MSSFFHTFFASLRRFDWFLVVGIVILSAIGLVSLASLNTELFNRQILWYVLFVLTILVGSQIHWRWLVGRGWFRQGAYWFFVLLILFTMFQSGTIRGTKSWIFIGSFQFQPSEFLKIALIFLLAGFFSRKFEGAWLGKNIFVSFLYAAIPSALVVLQPDLGTALVIMGVWVGFLFMSGFHLKRVIFMFFTLLFAGALSWFFLLQPYQKERITSFLFPDRDPLGASYNVIQSKIAVGSAGFLGKGFGFGTQSHLQFLPEAETDFLFASFIEEWGILGGIILLLTFLFVVFRIMNIGLRSANNDYRFISLGVALVLMIHFFINAGSNLGFTPVTGIPFPFLSYGGSHLLTLGVLISIIQRVKIES
ncbi:hypothetical protein CL629_01305 [bacterium]|nr:hypothetical protein [bacterium]|tara:strand:- start:29 stop:1120 length:1092 start_codon:yes stop_codon:yes gene_type:complete